MITRSSLRPHVCLRCQRNSTRRYTLPKPHVAFQSTSQPSGSSEPTIFNATRDGEKKEKSNFQIRRQPVLDTRRSKLKRNPNFNRLDKDASKLHGHRGRKLQEQIEDLKLSSLGDAAKAVVLRDSKYTFYTHVARMKDQEAEHVDIEKQLENERGLVSLDEVRYGINALRPQKGQEPESWEKLNEAIGVLSDGFTTAQLVNYIETFPATAADPIDEDVKAPHGLNCLELPMDELSSPSPAAHIMNATPWMPGISRISEDFDDEILRGYTVASHTSKQRLAMKIFRQCWQVEVPEISEGLGQFEVQLEKGDLDLMSTTSDSPLVLLQSEYLAHEDEGIEVFPTRGIIRITTLKHKRPIILQIIANDLASIQREAIPFGDVFRKRPAKGTLYSSWRDRYYSNAVLQELGQVTNTDVRTLSRDVVLVSTFAGDDRKSPSTRIDTVKRLLITVADTADQTRYSLECNNLTNGKYIKYPHTEGLNWWEKLRDWYRWTTPVFKDFEDKPVVGDFGKNDKLQTKKKSVSLQIQDFTPATSTPTHAWWGEFHDSSALFGSVLHNPTDNTSELTKPFDSTIGVIRGFSTVVPNLSRTFQKTRFSEGTEKRPQTTTPLKYITLRFLPDPFQPGWDGHSVEKHCEGHKYRTGIGGKVFAHFPSVEMRFSVLEDNAVKLKDVLAITSETKSDVMLPSNGVDIRFQDRTTRRLKHSKNLGSLQEFVERSIFDLRRGKLVTPPSLKLPIDGMMLSKEAQKSVNFKSESENVQYMFAGLDVRSTLSVNWKGWRLLYTSIEAGQAGGRRSELKLRPIKDGTVSSDQDFIAAANQLANEIGDSPALLEVAFGTPAEKITVKKTISKKDLHKAKENEVPTWGVNEKGEKGGRWKKRPQVFEDATGRKAWFVNQAWYDEPWDEDESGRLDIEDDIEEQQMGKDSSVSDRGKGT